MNKNKRRIRLSRLGTGIMITGVIAVIVMLCIIVVQHRLKQQLNGEIQPPTYYKHHYMMILDEKTDPFWTAVYESAKEIGEQSDACIELIGENLTASGELENSIALAIDSRIDGIILRAELSAEAEELVEQAQKQQIPVVRIVDNNSEADGSYVGINSYDVGQTYGRLLMELQEQKTMERVVLLSATETDGNQNTVFVSLSEILGESGITLTHERIDGNDVFAAKKSIRELVMAKDAPDVLICQNTTAALAAYDVVVDCNKVGDVQLLVNYATTDILNAIEKGGIYAAVSLDAQELGRGCVRCLDDLIGSRKTESYRSVPMVVITKENAANYRSDLEAVS